MLLYSRTLDFVHEFHSIKACIMQSQCLYSLATSLGAASSATFANICDTNDYVGALSWMSFLSMDHFAPVQWCHHSTGIQLRYLMQNNCRSSEVVHYYYYYYYYLKWKKEDVDKSCWGELKVHLEQSIWSFPLNKTNFLLQKKRWRVLPIRPVGSFLLPTSSFWLPSLPSFVWVSI